MQTSKPSPPISDATNTLPPSRKPHACTLCNQRKVRCDRLPTGCTNCTKARITCLYKLPSAPRRRKRALGEAELLARVRKYEEILAGLGVKVEFEGGTLVSFDDGSGLGAGDGADGKVSSSSPSGAGQKDEVEKVAREFGDVKLDTGKFESNVGARGVDVASAEARLVGSGGSTRYLSNHLWTNLTEVQGADEILQEYSDDEEADPFTEYCPIDPAELHLPSSRTAVNLKGLHPSPVQIFKLWQTFLENVSPLTKAVHTPTLQQSILEAVARLDGISKPFEALMFSIYATAVMTMSSEECLVHVHEEKVVLQRRYQFAAQQALINAGLLKTTDVVVLQAFIYYIHAIQPHLEPRTLWALTGLVVRIAQRIGLHRDGSSLGLPIFEAEIRRRVWWQCTILDGRAAELSGSPVMTNHNWETKIPLNINDSDLFPGMTEPPKEHMGATDMMLVSLSNETGTWLLNRGRFSSFNGVWSKLTSEDTPSEEKWADFKDLQERIETKITRYCDKAIPLHELTLSIYHAGLAKLRFMILKASIKEVMQSGTPVQQEKLKHELFMAALQLVEDGSIMGLKPSLRGFRWRMTAHFQWQPIIYLINELITRTSGPEVETAWKLMGDLYEGFDDILFKTNRTLPVAVGNLAIRAWTAYDAAKHPFGHPFGEEYTPGFIQVLRRQRGLFQTNESSPSSFDTGESVHSGASGLERLPPDAFAIPADHGLAKQTTNAHFDTTGVDAGNTFSTVGLGSEPAASMVYPEMTVNPTAISFDTTEMDWNEWNGLVQSYHLEMVDSNFGMRFSQDG